MNEYLPLMAIAGVTFGVLLSVGKGFKSSPDTEGFKVGRLISSLIIGVMGTLSISMLAISSLTEQLTTLGYVGFIFMFIAQGYATDSGLSKLDK